LQQKSDTSRVTDEPVLLLPALLSPKPVPRTRVSTRVLPSCGTSASAHVLLPSHPAGPASAAAAEGFFGFGRLIAGVPLAQAVVARA
jgi:hypothetical protein